ncbi:YheU family protein [Pseudohongiella spirulinae]|uniref:YheU family protein n=1 Tax=Pseudohongiella spirulinae TaxID=1249552 RepID=A0A0S2KDL6_9GAMM|nr:YheU family protein [Pseudohongiella spirulinae]ALO46079.1 hypothetical protein PS2015_1422 [Pseudohongiella spirulinae]
MRIPWQSLADETLTALIEEFVSREGTDYGQHEYTLEEKVSHVRRQLKCGDAEIDFDVESSTCNIVAVTK